jgi:hypothetical protein
MALQLIHRFSIDGKHNRSTCMPKANIFFQSFFILRESLSLAVCQIREVGITCKLGSGAVGIFSRGEGWFGETDLCRHEKWGWTALHHR